MHNKFCIDEQRINFLAEKIGIPKKTVRECHELFSEHILSQMKGQYLSHIIRTFEKYLRKVTNNPLFQIRCEAMGDENLNIGCSQYFRSRYFTAFYHPDMDDKQLRVCLAHELGHLFLVELCNSSQFLSDKDPQDINATEPLSTLFGLFTIIDKNKFYSIDANKYLHKSFEDIVEDFLMLSKRKSSS